MSKTSHSIALPMGLSIRLSDIAWFAWLVGLGLTIPFAYEVLFKSSFGIPGHHVEWMALVVVGRLTSNKRWAGTISGTTAAAAFPLMYGVKPTTGFTFLLVGVAFDILFMVMDNPKGIFTIGLIAALAHFTKPVFRIVVDLGTGLPYRPLLIAAWWPMVTHLVFGFVGGLIGVLIVRTNQNLIELFRKKMNKLGLGHS